MSCLKDIIRTVVETGMQNSTLNNTVTMLNLLNLLTVCYGDVKENPCFEETNT